MTKLIIHSKGFVVVIIVILMIAMLGILLGIKYKNTDKIEKNIIAIQNEIDRHYNNNSYIQMQVGENQIVAFLYNKDKEAFAQSNEGGLSVYRKDNRFIHFGDPEVNISYGVSPFGMFDIAIQSVKDGYAKLKTTTNKSTKLKKYEITLKGSENIRKLYSQINAVYAEEMVKQLYNENIVTKKGVLSFTIVTGENKEFGGACEFDIKNQKYTVWYFDGYLELFDWGLTEEWYNTDGTNREKWVELINTLVDDIELKTKEFANSSNIELDNEDNVSNTVNNEKAVNVDFGDIRATGITYDEWVKLTNEEKQDIVHEALHQIEANGYTVIDNYEAIAIEVDNYYETGDKDINVATIILIIGQASETIQ